MWITNLSTVAITANDSDVTAPDGTNQAAKLERSGIANSYIYRENEHVLEEDEYYTFSIFVKNDDAKYLNIRVGKGINDEYVLGLYNLEDGIVERAELQSDSTHIENLEVVLTSVGDGWYSAQVGFLCKVALNVDIYVSCRKTNGLVTDIDLGSNDLVQDSSVFLWLPALERRRLDRNTSYLGSAVFGVQSAPENAFSHIPVWSADTVSVEYLDFKNDLFTIDVEHPLNFTTEKAVEYVQIPHTAYHGFPDRYIVNDNQGDSFEYRLNREDVYSKYRPVRCTFVNNRGVLEDFWFSRKNEVELGVKNNDYYHNTINYDRLDYDRYGHSDRKFNVEGKKRIRLYTDFIQQQQNVILEHMFMSEQVWLTIDGNTFSVNVSDKKMTYKTHINHKLVSYEILFEYANRLANKVR